MTRLSDSLHDTIREQLKEVIPSPTYETWIDPIEFYRQDERAVVVPVANVYVQDWFERKYKSVISKALCCALQKEVEVVFRVSPAADPRASSEREPASPQTITSTHETEQAQGSVATLPMTDLQIIPAYTFENFVVGQSNRLAHAAALGAAENPSRAYNPLFLHGAVGLGKTHLLQAICHTLLSRLPDIRIHYTSCEGFVNDYISAVKRSELDPFRRKYRELDVLLIDDIHFLANKEGSQEEFFHTFNALHNASRQIILSSDSSPEDIATLEDRLISRFKWGMVARIDPPTFETRVAILRKKAETSGYDIPNDVLNYIAEKIDTNIRELEGAVLTVTMRSEVESRSISLELAREALGDVSRSRPRPIQVSDIQTAVCDHFNIRLSDLQSRKRSQMISLPRQIAIYLTRRLTPYSLEDIGGYFSGKDHSTIMYAIDRIKERVASDPQLRATVEALHAHLLEQSQKHPSWMSRPA